MNALEISKGIFSVGVTNPDLRIFDIVIPTQFGSTYNAYLVKGEKALALIDTVHSEKSSEYLTDLQNVCDLSKVDYIVMNHTEPDHSGSLEKLLELAPNAKVVGTVAALKFLRAICNRDFPSITVKDGMVVDLGGKTLEFIVAPNLHWPDSMFTYVKENKLIFTCDFLGAHFCGAPMLSEVLNLDDYKSSLKLYFDCIFAPFKKFVQNGLKKIDSLNLEFVCPSHGPILDTEICQTIETYHKWSEEKSVGNTAVIAYCSAYGYTKDLARVANDVLHAHGYTVHSFDLGVTPAPLAANAANEAKLFLIGSPTLNKDALPPVWYFIAHLSAITAPKKKVGVFGSYGWTGEAVPHIVDHLKQMKFNVQGEGFRVNFKPSANELEKMKAYVEALLSESKP
ncbi:MAG: FprA family A-type flavoprotein [Fibrobacteraceae bacterium]